MRFVCVSDTHCRLRRVKVPDGDILLHAGDLTFSGNTLEIAQELRELGRIGSKFKRTLLVPGNHDWLFERDPDMAKDMCDKYNITLLHENTVTIDGTNFYGSAFQPEFCAWAFNLPRGEELKKVWNRIPDNTDVLVTHGPPYGILDECPDGRIVGCQDLLKRVSELKQLKLHVFGHIHHSYGRAQRHDTTFVNASICTEEYKPSNIPIIVNI